MRLSRVRLAGFKSFVDPTALVLPSNLVAVVGPNGCGKSNVIDAVRWVMGESSARQLRGDSMADVIFNGSTSRKPVGQATIELVFDNADGGAGGQYAQYAEIAIRRQVTRDGQSAYFLNGARCRRRDITDVFLGTGLGPRSYAIIEQGMISRVVEARPEDLRVFIEEAAGISKYKERRRETETRMRHTQENLARLGDVREELERQLQHLQRQARTAERYKELRQEERRVRAELLALRWRALDQEARALAAGVVAADNAHESALAGQRQAEAALERARATQTAVADAFGHVQARSYAVGADLARAEQDLAHARERREQLRQELERVDKSRQDAAAGVAADRQQLAGLQEELAAAEPALAEAREVEQEAREVLSAAEQAMHEWQSAWDGFNQRAAEPAREAEVERTRIHHLEQQLRQLQQRAARAEEEGRGLDPGALEGEIGTLDARLQELDVVLDEQDTLVGAGRSRVEALRGQTRDLAQQLHEGRGRLQARRGRLGSLEALQQQALGRQQADVARWVQARGLGGALRLAEGLRVDPGWELAVEVVLGHHLQAVCVDSLADLAPGAGEVSRGVLGLFETGPGTDPPGSAARVAPPLSERVHAPWPVAGLFQGICTVASVDEALALRGGLGEQESVVTADGIWLGRRWLRVNREADEKAGVLAREQEIRQLEAETEELDALLEDLAGRQEEATAELRRVESDLALGLRQAGEAQRRHAALQSELSGKRARLEQLGQRLARVRQEQEEIAASRRSVEEDLAQARGRLEQCIGRMEILTRERQALTQERERCRSRLDAARHEWNAARERAHRQALRAESMRTRRDALAGGLQRAESHAAVLEERCAELARLVAEAELPLEQARLAQDAVLSRRLEVEAELRAARQAVEAVEAEQREREADRHRAEEQVRGRRAGLEQARIAEQGTAVRLQGVREQLQEQGFAPAELLETLPEQAAQAEWHGRLEELERRIARLGPINLAAIDEYAQQSERKQYLDAQHADLTEALATLQDAIRRIDRETRGRFRDTFDRLNTGLKSMFPRLFGGGHAYLELTSEDLLETGVTVMARPPGKRNSTIHLLSGGEKALTAVALVFAIFELNPAPFCLLDEVDAPLDEANVGRFCELVRSMSDRVQFVIITHNKTTMAMAEHLVGVTMKEAGVSRLVTVDVAEAVQLAAV